MLNRLFHEQASGFYIDVGAWDPNMHSVTKHFYQCGWHGVNIEPLRSKFELFQRERPRDANLNVAVGDGPGEMRFFECMEESYLSTPDPVIADQFRARGGTVTEYTVPVVTLNEIFEKYCPGPVEFLKIDVEGWEKPAIESCDWRRFRPRALVIEATKPATPPASWDDLESIARWHDWEPIILANRYVFAYFDGLNRFYVREEDAALAGRFQLPPGIFDDIRYEKFDQNQELKRLLKESEADRAELTRLLKESEADRAELTRLLKESEADRAARLEQIHELTRLLRNRPGRWLLRAFRRGASAVFRPRD
jgi:FkbM family methyltransferase